MAETFTRGRALLLLLLLVGVVGSGLVKWWLASLGYDTLGTVLWILGYGGMVVTVWYGWVRPLDITGPDPEGGPD